MKKKIVLLVVLVISFAAGNALANDLLNPGFELGALGRFDPPNVTNWTTVGTKGWHTGNTSANDFVHSGAKAVKVWWDDTSLYQDISVIAGNRYDFSVWAYAFSGDDLGLRFADAVFHVKWYDAGSTLISDEEIGRFYGAKVVGEPCDPYDTWKFISGSRTSPPLAVTCRVRLYLDRHDGAFEIKGSIFWDDASVSFSYGASNPVPEDGALNLIPFEVTALSWDRPAPRQVGDTILCDVWFGTDPNMPGTNTKILNKQDASSVAISSLASNQDYYWRVDCYDPDGANPEIKSEGQTWTFNTADNCYLSYMLGDINKDCYVNFADFAEMGENWLKCNDVSNSNCQ
ncbi:MAG: hypothetical protein LLF92_05515 [Planctomycetaceae bacterium]|nr:hypothetical protein [Planctomycetaceae bacterium]